MPRPVPSSALLLALLLGGCAGGDADKAGPDTGTGWTAVMKNIENALPVQQYAGPTANGGYWNDGASQKTPRIHPLNLCS